MLNIVLATEFTPLLSEVTAIFQASRLPTNLIPVGNLDQLTACCQNELVEVVIADSTSRILPVRGVLECARQYNPGCLVYGLFDALQEDAIADSIRHGATSFLLREQLAELPGRIETAYQSKHQQSLAKNYSDSAEHILNALLEESTDSIWAKDRHGHYLLINPAGAKFLKKPIEDILGKTDYEVFPPETANKVIKSDSEVMQKGQTETIEEMLMTRDGIERTFQAVKGVFRDAQGSVQGVLGTVRDITARKKAEDALRDSEQRFRLLVEAVKDYAIYMLDPDGRITTWNIGAERLHGYGALEIVGEHVACLYEDNPDALNRRLQSAIESSYYEQDGWLLRKDGSKYWASIMTTPLYNDKGVHIGFSQIVRDMSAHRQAERELQYYASKLEQSNRDLEEFAFIASHDLQAPLRKISIFTEMLQNFASSEDQDIARRLLTATGKMQQFISDLLALSRINRKAQPFESVCLNTVMRGVMDDLEAVIADRQAQVVVEDLGVVYGDPVQLGQLLLNLLNNSLKFKKANASITITVKGEALENGYYQVRIQDTGIGFKESELDRIFRPFERLHGESEYPGTGMGLAICKKIIDRHSGQITAASEEGKGATFFIYLPMSPEPPQSRILEPLLEASPEPALEA
jgi:PAS domain S-box-containing protein